MSISTKGVKKNFISKELKPGNVVAKINNLTIETGKNPKDPKIPEYKIWIELESKPIGGDFVGFDKVYGDPTKGQYLGQTKKIQFSNWPIKTREGVTKAGKKYKILDSAIILEFIQKLLDKVGAPTWLEDNDGKFDTWEQLFAGVIRSKLLKDKYFAWCIGATESVNTAGYAVYYMYLPDYKVCPEPFGLEGELVTTFSVEKHMQKDKKATENEALNNGSDEEEDNSVARENEDNEFANAPDDSPFDMDDSELFDMDED
jgi:hypothetical protein